MAWVSLNRLGRVPRSERPADSHPPLAKVISSRRRLLDNRDFLIRQAVQFVSQLVGRAVVVSIKCFSAKLFQHH
jgi:hypothetical protein